MNAAWTRPDRVTSDNMLSQARALVADDTPGEAEPGVWTIAAMKSAARVACSRVRAAPSSLCEVDPVSTALSGVGLAVATSPDITWSEAVASGQRALWDALSGVRASHGIGKGGEARPRFSAYWLNENVSRVPHPGEC